MSAFLAFDTLMVIIRLDISVNWIESVNFQAINQFKKVSVYWQKP